MWHLETEDVVRLDHPGYGKKYGSEDIVGARYYEELRKWLCGFCDGHTFRYLHPKNFEIASVGSLLLADRIIEGPMNELGFVDQETCIFCDREDAKEKVEWIVDDRNRSEVDRIRAAGMGLVWGKHLTRHRAGDIDKIFRSALGVWS